MRDLLPAGASLTHGGGYRAEAEPNQVWANGLHVGTLSEGEHGAWGWNDAILGTVWYWNVQTHEIRAFLTIRCRPDFPSEKVQTLFDQWRQEWAEHGRFSEQAERVRERLSKTINGRE